MYFPCNCQTRRNKKKGKNNCKGGNKNENDNFNDKNALNARGDKQSKCKVKFPCKLCKEDHLTNLFPHMEDALRFMAQGPTVLTNPLCDNQNMNSRTNDPHCASGGDQNPPEFNTGHGCINMVHAIKVVTHVKDYVSSQPDLGKEPAPPKILLRIENLMDKLEIAPHIPKGVLKHSGHNPNAQTAQNYSIIEDLGQNPCAIFALEVLQSFPL